VGCVGFGLVFFGLGVGGFCVCCGGVFGEFALKGEKREGMGGPVAAKG